MARKSRKNLPQPEQATVSVQFPELDEENVLENFIKSVLNNETNRDDMGYVHGIP